MPTLPEISKITLPSNNTYAFKDEIARNMIEALEGFTKFLGVTTTELEDGDTTNPITINGASVTAQSGDIVTYGNHEFIFNGTAWQEFGDLEALGALAYKDNASGSFTPAGTISLTDTNKKATVNVAASGETTYQPGGTVSVPTITLGTAGATTTVNSITDVGTLPSATMPTYTVSDETLTISAGTFSAGTLPTKGSDITVKTGDATYEASQPTFTGNAVRLETGDIAVPTSATFNGTQGTVTVS